MLKGTTIVAVRKNGRATIGGDGRLLSGQNTIMKHGARKVATLP